MAATIEQIQAAASDWSIEVTPAGASKIESFADCLHPGTTVNVTFLPGSDPMDTVAVSERLHNEGMNPVPHLAARSLRDSDQLDALLAAYTSRAGVNEVLVIGGGVDQPVGAFANSLQLLETGLIQSPLLLGSPFLSFSRDSLFRPIAIMRKAADISSQSPLRSSHCKFN